MYKVIEYFEDLQDNGRPYHVGDIFPREGISVSVDRLTELSTNKNRRKKPLIKLMEVAVNQENDNKTFTKTEINRMPLAELKELAKREGIDADEMKGGEIKTALIEKYNL